MRFGRVTRNLTSWLAVLAILMAMFAPVISQAMAQDASRTWLEVCSTSKANWTQASSFDSRQVPVQGNQAHFFEHCPYCALHADLLPVLPTPSRWSAPLPVAEAVPVAFLHAPRTSHVWLRAQPRAPPLLG